MSNCENNEIQKPTNAIRIPFVPRELCDMDYIVCVFEEENIGKVSSVEILAEQVKNGCAGHSVTVYIEEWYKNDYLIQTPWGENMIEKTLCDDLREQPKGLRYITIIPPTNVEAKYWVLKMADSVPKQYAFLPDLDKKNKKKLLAEIHNELFVREEKLVVAKVRKYVNTLNILTGKSSYYKSLYYIKILDIVIELYMYLMEKFDILLRYSLKENKKGLFIQTAHLKSAELLNELNTNDNYVFAEDEVLKEKVNIAKTILTDYIKLSIKYYVSTIKALTPKLNNDVLTVIFDSLYSNLNINPLDVKLELDNYHLELIATQENFIKNKKKQT